MTDTTETEFKLRAIRPLEVALVDAALRELGVPCRASASGTHTDTYLDDDRGTLAAAGIGLRLRVGSGLPRLTCKARGSATNGLFVREEHDSVWSSTNLPQAARELPPELRDRIEPFVLDRVLQPVLTMVTQRDTRMLVHEDQDLCELTIDRVEAGADGRSIVFHEVELEVADDLDTNRRLVDSLLQRLPLQTAADDKPTYATARLGLHAVVMASVGPEASIVAAVMQLTARHLDCMHTAEVGVRSDRDPEHLHAMRVAVRRLRSVVRAFRDLWPHDVADGLLAALGEVGSQLGAVRDLDVTLAALAAQCAELPTVLRLPAERTVAWIRNLRTTANEGLQAWLRSNDRLRAQGELETTLSACDRTSTLAMAPTKNEVQSRIAHAAARLRRAIAEISPELPTEPLHALRLASKRLRYLAEEFDRLPGQDYEKSLGKIIALQQALGAVCDHDLAARRLIDWIRPAVEASADGALMAAALGGLAACNTMAAAKARKRARSTLARVDRKRVWKRFEANESTAANTTN